MTNDFVVSFTSETLDPDEVMTYFADSMKFVVVLGEDIIEMFLSFTKDLFSDALASGDLQEQFS